MNPAPERFYFILRSAQAKRGFTLIELLVVIGILAILATVTVLVLNPAQLFAQARDSRRVSDLQTISSAMKFVSLQELSEGTANTVYVSIPDTSTTCANLSFPTLPSGYTYACATANNFRKVDGTGWRWDIGRLTKGVEQRQPTAVETGILAPCLLVRIG